MQPVVPPVAAVPPVPLVPAVPLMPPVPDIPPVPVKASPSELLLHALSTSRKDKVSKDIKIR